MEMAQPGVEINKLPKAKNQDEEFEARVIAIVLEAIKGQGRIYREILAELERDLSNVGGRLKF
jgi:hypothetical protein